MAEPNPNPPNPDPYIQLRLFAGGVLILLLVGAVVIAMTTNNMPPHQYNVLRMLMAAFTAILFVVFGGAISVKTTSVAACGGTAIWLLFPWLFPALPANMTLNLLLKLGNAPLAEAQEVTIHFNDEHPAATTSSDGTVLFRVPNGLEQISEIIIGDGKTYAPVETGPYTVTPGVTITVPITRLTPEGRQGGPRRPNENTDIPRKPPEDEVNAYNPAHEPEEVRLKFHNKSSVDMTLWLFDCSRFYAGKNNYWKELRFPHTVSPLDYEDFDPRRDGKGFYCVLIELSSAPGKYIYLGDRKIFDVKAPEIIVDRKENRFELK